MRLPDRLDYDTIDVPGLEDDVVDVPRVVCTVSGCDWTYAATWVDLGPDGDVDWDAEHPAH